MGKVIAVCNQKGGTGKTTTTINLGGVLAKIGLKILLIDGDKQGNLTQGCGYHNNSIFKFTLRELMIAEAQGGNEEQIQEIFNNTIGRINFNVGQKEEYFFTLLPANNNIAAMDDQLKNFIDTQCLLKGVLEKSRVRDFYDYVFVDCPPTLDLMTVNILSACDELLIPVDSGLYATLGMGDLFSIINQIRRRLNPQLKINGILFTERTPSAASKSIIEKISMEYGDEYVYGATIRHSKAAIEGAAIQGIPLIEYALKFPPSKIPQIAKDYYELAVEFYEHTENIPQRPVPQWVTG